MPKHFAKFILLVILFSSLMPTATHAADGKSVLLDLQIPIGSSNLQSGDDKYNFGSENGTNEDSYEIDIGNDHTLRPLGEYIRWIYKYLIGIAGILATIMMMFGGFRWLASGGDSGAIGEAKNIISSALIGLVLATTSYLILSTVNTDLVNLKTPEIVAVAPLGCCQMTNSCSTASEKECQSPGAFVIGKSCIDKQCVVPTPEQKAVADGCVSEYGGKGIVVSGIGDGDCNFKGTYKVLYGRSAIFNDQNTTTSGILSCCEKPCITDQPGSSCTVTGYDGGSTSQSKNGFCSTNKTCEIYAGKKGEWCGLTGSTCCLAKSNLSSWVYSKANTFLAVATLNKIGARQLEGRNCEAGLQCISKLDNAYDCTAQ